jgi:hypothetical protein
MADELRSMTRAGAMPTLRAIDTPTIAPEHATTISSAPTAVSPVTLPPASATSSTRPGGSAPPLAPTILTPGTATSPGGPSPAGQARPAPPARAAQPGRAAKSGSGLGLVLGLGAVGFLLLVALAGGGWWLLKHSQTGPTASPTPVADLATPTPALPPPTTAPAVSPPAESGPTPATSPMSGATPTATAAPRASATPRPEGNRKLATAGPSDASQGGATGPHAESQQPPAQGGDYGFLNNVPAQGPDGRELGEALAKSYQSHGSSGVTGRRFNARQRVPRDVAPIERPAVATLLHLMFMEQAYQRQNSRYGNLHELKAAGLLHLDVPFAKGQFERARYRFELTGNGSEYKATATPLVVGARPFLADDNGFVRVDE